MMDEFSQVKKTSGLLNPCLITHDFSWPNSSRLKITYIYPVKL
jgi:hypothetical protein